MRWAAEKLLASYSTVLHPPKSLLEYGANVKSAYKKQWKLQSRPLLPTILQELPLAYTI